MIVFRPRRHLRVRDRPIARWTDMDAVQNTLSIYRINFLQSADKGGSAGRCADLKALRISRIHVDVDHAVLHAFSPWNWYPHSGSNRDLTDPAIRYPDVVTRSGGAKLMATRPFEWMNLVRSEGPSHDGALEYRAHMELADVLGSGLRKEWITIHSTSSIPLPHLQQEAELTVLIHARDALDQQISAMKQSL